MLRQRQAPLEVVRLLPEHCLFFRRPRPLEPHELGCEGFAGPRGVLAMVRTMADCLAFLPDPRGGELCSLVLRENGGSSLAPPPPPQQQPAHTQPLPAPAPLKALAPPPSHKVLSRLPPPPPHAASRQAALLPRPSDQSAVMGALLPRPSDQSAVMGDDKGSDHRTWLQPNKHPTSALVEFLQSMHANAGLSAASEWSPTYEMQPVLHPVPPGTGGEGHIRCVARAGGQVATAEAADKKMAKFGASQALLSLLCPEYGAMLRGDKVPAAAASGTTPTALPIHTTSTAHGRAHGNGKGSAAGSAASHAPSAHGVGPSTSELGPLPQLLVAVGGGQARPAAAADATVDPAPSTRALSAEARELAAGAVVKIEASAASAPSQRTSCACSFVASIGGANECGHADHTTHETCAVDGRACIL